MSAPEAERMVMTTPASELSGDQLEEALRVAEGQRGCTVFGSFRGVLQGAKKGILEDVSSPVANPIDSGLSSSSTTAKRILLLKPRGFCAGVVRAIDIVRIALETFGAPIYVRKEIVHNRFVVEELQQKGAIFVDSVEEVPAGERVIYSAHGVSPEVREASKRRKLRVVGATCPRVAQV